MSERGQYPAGGGTGRNDVDEGQPLEMKIEVEKGEAAN